MNTLVYNNTKTSTDNNINKTIKLKKNSKNVWKSLQILIDFLNILDSSTSEIITKTVGNIAKPISIENNLTTPLAKWNEFQNTIKKQINFQFLIKPLKK